MTCKPLHLSLFGFKALGHGIYSIIFACYLTPGLASVASTLSVQIKLDDVEEEMRDQWDKCFSSVL